VSFLGEEVNFPDEIAAEGHRSHRIRLQLAGLVRLIVRPRAIAAQVNSSLNESIFCSEVTSISRWILLIVWRANSVNLMNLRVV